MVIGPVPTTSSTCSPGAPRHKVEVVTLWLLSSDNLSRPADELLPLLDIIDATVIDLAADDRHWRVHPVGSLDLLRDSTVRVLKEADEATRDKTGLVVNVAIGYGGRREIADAVRACCRSTHLAARRWRRSRASSTSSTSPTTFTPAASLTLTS